MNNIIININNICAVINKNKNKYYNFKFTIVFTICYRKTNEKRSGKVVLELRQEPNIKVIKTTTPLEVLEISDDDDDDTTLPQSM